MDPGLKAEKLNEFLYHVKKASCMPKQKSIPHILQQNSIYGQSYSGSTKAEIGRCFIPKTKTWYYNFRFKVFNGFFDKSGDKFISSAQDRIIKIFDTHEFSLGEKIACRDVGWSILDIALSSDGQRLVYSSWSNMLYLVDLSRSEDDSWIHRGVKLNNDSRVGVFSLQFAGDNRRVFCGLNYGDVLIYDLETQRRVDQISQGHSEEDINTISIMDQSGNVFLTGADDCLIKVWDSRDLSQGAIGTFAGHQDGIVHIDSKGDFRYFVSNSKDQRIKLWDFRRFSKSDEFHTTPHRMSWDYRWHQIPKRYLKSMDTPTDASLMTLRGHRVQHTLIRARFSPAHSTGQRYVYSGSACGSWFLWDLLTGSLVGGGYSGHGDTIRDVSWHPWQPLLMTSSFDGYLMAWTPQGCVDPASMPASSTDLLPPDREASDEYDSDDEHSIQRRCHGFIKVYLHSKKQQL